eukprot:s5446_g1.t1
MFILFARALKLQWFIAFGRPIGNCSSASPWQKIEPRQSEVGEEKGRTVGLEKGCPSLQREEACSLICISGIPNCECRELCKDAFTRELDSIYDEVSSKIEGFGFFEADISIPPRVLQRQRGVVRTNCFDSLDRTNLLQYQVAWRWLQAQLPTFQSPVSSGYRGAAAETGHLQVTLRKPSRMGAERMKSERQFVAILCRSMWADLGDALSEQYTGTASTMGAALRQGGHTARAMLEKGWRAVNRAYCAHFEDDARQSAIQLLLRSQKLAKAPSIPELRRSPQGKLRLALAAWNLHGRAPWQSAETLRRANSLLEDLATCANGALLAAGALGCPALVAQLANAYAPETILAESTSALAWEAACSAGEVKEAVVAETSEPGLGANCPAGDWVPFVPDVFLQGFDSVFDGEIVVENGSHCVLRWNEEAALVLTMAVVVVLDVLLPLVLEHSTEFKLQT